MEKVHAFQKLIFCGCLVLIANSQFCSALMERKTWSVHFGMETSDKPVQNQKKKRSQSDKIGRLKYNQQLLKQTLAEIEEVKLMLRTILAGLKGSFQFERSLIEKISCKDEIDREITRLLFESGNRGLLPKDIAFKLERFKVTRHQVSRRILRMNKRLVDEIGEYVAEQRGYHWALTGFAAEAWGDNEFQNEEPEQWKN
jgi:hypothetical protein